MDRVETSPRTLASRWLLACRILRPVPEKLHLIFNSSALTGDRCEKPEERFVTSRVRGRKRVWLGGGGFAFHVMSKYCSGNTNSNITMCGYTVFCVFVSGLRFASAATSVLSPVCVWLSSPKEFRKHDSGPPGTVRISGVIFLPSILVCGYFNSENKEGRIISYGSISNTRYVVLEEGLGCFQCRDVLKHITRYFNLRSF